VVAGSVSVGVIAIFHFNPNYGPGSTQLLTEMSTRSISSWVKAAGA
jgi:hypothetical protein